MPRSRIGSRENDSLVIICVMVKSQTDRNGQWRVILRYTARLEIRNLATLTVNTRAFSIRNIYILEMC